jgi:hypothetical protein
LDNIRFRAVPAKIEVNGQLPFELNLQDLTKWLNSLSRVKKMELCLALFKALLAMGKTDPVEQMPELYNKVAEFLDGVLVEVEKELLNPGFPLDPEDQAIIEVIVFAYVTLAENYAHLLTVPNLVNKASLDRAMQTYNALQSADKALLLILQVYKQAYPEFWLFCYRLFEEAKREGWLYQPLTVKTGKISSIGKIFSQLLLLQLSDTNQYRSREMRLIDKLYEELGFELSFEETVINDGSHWHCFDANKDAPPGLLKNKLVVDDGVYIFCLTPVAKKIYDYVHTDMPEQGALKAINRSLYVRVVKTLGCFQKRRHKRFDDKTDGTGILGFNNIVSFLYKTYENHETKPKIALNQSPEKKLKASDLDLVPQGGEKVHQLQWQYRHDEDTTLSKIVHFGKDFTSPGQVWDLGQIENSKLVDKVPTNALKVIDTSLQGMQVFWKSNGLKVKHGDLFAAIQGNGRLEIGLIRRLSRLTQGGAVLGIELLGYETELVKFFRPGHKSVQFWGLYLSGLPALKQNDSLIFNAPGFSAGENIVIERGQKQLSCRLQKIINETPAVSHAELQTK